MKLVVQIPCYNEEKTLPRTIRDIPREIEGIDRIEILVIDDGSTDRTAEVARSLGATVVRHVTNKGLATAFMTGIHKALEMGADMIVNTDADNQYKGEFIPAIVKPILDGTADMVIGVRPIEEISHFSPVKKVLQKLGSAVVRLASGIPVEDAPSGFRALSRDTALKLNIFSKYTYTLETIIQAGMRDLTVKTVPVEVNPPTRPSRLFKSTFSYILKSAITIIRIFILYKAFRFFALIGSILFGAGFLLGARFLYFYFTGNGTGHVQSLILASILITLGFYTFLSGILADLISSNRRLLEEIQYNQRRRLINDKKEGGPDRA